MTESELPEERMLAIAGSEPGGHYDLMRTVATICRAQRSIIAELNRRATEDIAEARGAIAAYELKVGEQRDRIAALDRVAEAAKTVSFELEAAEPEDDGVVRHLTLSPETAEHLDDALRAAGYLEKSDG